MKKYYKILFWLIWLALVFVGPYTIIKNSRLDLVFSDPGLTIAFFQRLTGVTVFCLLFIQIILGEYIKKSKIYAINGVILYTLLVIHPLLFLLFNYRLRHVIDPFYVFTQVCLICKKTEIIYSLGRVSFWLAGLAVFAALFRRKLHTLNYFIFFLVAVHGFFADSDFRLSPLKFVYWFSIIVVILTLFFECGRSRRQEKFSG